MESHSRDSKQKKGLKVISEVQNSTSHGKDSKEVYLSGQKRDECTSRRSPWLAGRGWHDMLHGLFPKCCH